MAVGLAKAVGMADVHGDDQILISEPRDAELLNPRQEEESVWDGVSTGQRAVLAHLPERARQAQSRPDGVSIWIDVRYDEYLP
jgi:hypothetical protein